MPNVTSRRRERDVAEFVGKETYYTRAASWACALTFFSLFKKSSGVWVKIKLKLPHLHVLVSDTCRVSTQPDAPVTAANAAATEHVGLSTRPGPEGSGAVEIATRRGPRILVVWDLRELYMLGLPKKSTRPHYRRPHLSLFR